MSTNLESKSNDAGDAHKPVIDIRYGQIGLLQVRLHTTDPGAILDEMSGRVAAAPQFFRRTGVCLDLGELETVPSLSQLRGVMDAVRRVGMLSIGLVGDAEALEGLASGVDLPVLSGFRAPTRPVPGLNGGAHASGSASANGSVAKNGSAIVTKSAAAPKSSAEPAVAPTPPAAEGLPALMQLQAVRSGQRIYARHRDLIVTAGVAAGAEVMADGCLHVYGALRGRAMAGAHGDLTARVFCQEFAAELVSIAGVFRVFETIPAELAGKPVQVWLEGENLRCAPLGG